jgi:phosphotransacetylase
MTQGLTPVRTAVVHPVDTVSLLGAIEAAREQLIVPLLIGPKAKICAAAAQAQLDISPYELISTEHSEAASVPMARAGKVEALIKGALHTDKLMHAVGRRWSRLAHGTKDQPYFRHRRTWLSEATLGHGCGDHAYPTLDDKRDIVQNAIDLAHALGIAAPKVAILEHFQAKWIHVRVKKMRYSNDQEVLSDSAESENAPAAVETVTTKLRSTLDAAALCKMADRGQIVGGIIDGPLAFDNAVSEEAAKTKGILSPVKPIFSSSPTSKPGTC